MAKLVRHDVCRREVANRRTLSVQNVAGPHLLEGENRQDEHSLIDNTVCIGDGVVRAVERIRIVRGDSDATLRHERRCVGLDQLIPRVGFREASRLEPFDPSLVDVGDDVVDVLLDRVVVVLLRHVAGRCRRFCRCLLDGRRLAETLYERLHVAVELAGLFLCSVCRSNDCHGSADDK